MQLGVLSLALIDDLTGFNNRRGFLALAEHHANLAYRTGKTFLVAFVDFDGLKRINDTFGHQEGNRALVDASIVLRDSFRQSDILARLGGDEFAILVADAAENDIEAVRHRIDRKLCSFNADPGRRYDLSFSVGLFPMTLANIPTLSSSSHKLTLSCTDRSKARRTRVNSLHPLGSIESKVDFATDQDRR